MAVFTILKSKYVGSALYEDGKLIATWDLRDIPKNIENQIRQRVKESDELVEMQHKGDFPDVLPDDHQHTRTLRDSQRPAPKGKDPAKTPRHDNTVYDEGMDDEPATARGDEAPDLTEEPAEPRPEISDDQAVDQMTGTEGSDAPKPRQRRRRAAG